MRTERYLRLVDFALWVLAAAAVAVVVAVALGLLIGGNLVAAKYATFVVGFLMFGAGSIAIQPSGPDLGEAEASAEAEGGGLGGLGRGTGGAASGIEDDGSDDAEHRYEARLQEVGPLADHHLPYEHRVSRGVKVFAASIVVLAVSFFMELAGVQV